MRSISPLTGRRGTEDHFVVPSGGKQVVADGWATFRKWDFPGPFCGMTLIEADLSGNSEVPKVSSVTYSARGNLLNHP